MNAAIAKAKLEGEAEDKHIAVEARVHSTELPKIVPILSKEDVALVFVSQYRSKIGIQFGDKNETAGGAAPKYYASLMLKVEYIGKEKDGDAAVGSKTRVTCVKNQISPPFKVAEYEIKWGIGIDRVSSLLERAVEAGVVDKSGAFYSFNGSRLGQGRSNVLEFLRSEENVRDDIGIALLEESDGDELFDDDSDDDVENDKTKKRRKSGSERNDIG
jgi:recombination protein RecA